jgi:radical SAM superfamily enzyme YgiQ (UPF0313 family)
MKILFVFLNNEYRTFVPPNLVSLEGYVKSYGHETKVFDTSFYPDVVNLENIERNIKAGTYKGVDYSKVGVVPKTATSSEDFLRCIEEFRPDVIGFSVYGYTSDIANKLAQAAKEKFPSTLIIYGGIEITLHPFEYLSMPYVDLVCLGEGEKAIAEICNRVEQKNYNFEGIPNIRFIKPDGEIHIEKLGDFIDLDTIPDPDWSSYMPYQYNSPFNGVLQKMAMVEFSRGCPYSCTYCESTTLKNLHASEGLKKYVRHKSPDKFVRECKKLVDDYGVEMFYIVDGTFLVMPDKVLEELAIKFKKIVNKPFFCLTTAPSVTPRRAELMAMMGCVQVNMGIEAGNEDYRKNILSRPKMTNDLIVNSFLLMRKNGIKTSSYNMIGMPWQKRDDVWETINLNRLAKPDYVNVSIFIPFEGTLLLDRLRKEGYVEEDLILGDESRATVRVPGGMSLDETERLYKVFTLYCTVPDYVLPELREIECSPERYSDRIKQLQEEFLAPIFPLPASRGTFEIEKAAAT